MSEEVHQPHSLPDGVSRRDFMKFCSFLAAGMALPASVAPAMAEAITNPQRPPGSPPAQGSARCSRNVALTLWPSGQRASDRRLAGPACTLAGIRMALPLIKLGTGQTFLSQVVNRF